MQLCRFRLTVLREPRPAAGQHVRIGKEKEEKPMVRGQNVLGGPTHNPHSGQCGGHSTATPSSG